jgi:DNA-binding CsgD family transcriptional regulator
VPKDERRKRSNLELAKAVADEARDGIVICDNAGELIHVNAAAAALLSATHTADIQRISLSAITLGERQQAQLNGFFVSARPVRAGNANPIGIVTIRIHAPLPGEESLRARFALSKREAQVAVLLAERRTDAEIAAALGISWHTVRSHVERIFASLHCHSRRDAATKLKSAEAHTDSTEDNSNE